jgi:hypothetical protein
MTDDRLRSLSRAALAGDLAASVALLAAERRASGA